MSVGWSAISAAILDFFAQPFGVVGAVGIMAAVTTINSARLTAGLRGRGVPVGVAFNCLYLVGGASLLINAAIRQEIVWLVLQSYMIAITVKGLWRAIQASAGEQAPARRMLGRTPRSTRPAAINDCGGPPG